MNNQSQTTNQNLTLITKNGSICLGTMDDKSASPASKDPIQLELDFNQMTTDNH